MCPRLTYQSSAAPVVTCIYAYTDISLDRDLNIAIQGVPKTSPFRNHSIVVKRVLLYLEEFK